MYDIVKTFYQMHIYSVDDVRVFVRSGDITLPQFKEITGEDY